MNYLEDSLKRRVLFFTGKGGVGKSTLAWATALACRRQNKKVAVVGWRPLGKEEPSSGQSKWDIPNLALDTLSAFRDYALHIVRFEKLYDSVLDNQILRTFVLAAPGLADAVVAAKICELSEKDDFDLLIVDMPSSGHARSFFRSPLGIQKIFKIGFIARDAERVCSLFRSEQTRLDLVAMPAELPLVECHELKQGLSLLHPFSFGFLHINQAVPDWVATSPEQQNGLASADRAFFQSWNDRFVEQERVLDLARPIELPRVTTPRFAADWMESVQLAADHLERQ